MARPMAVFARLRVFTTRTPGDPGRPVACGFLEKERAMREFQSMAWPLLAVIATAGTIGGLMAMTADIRRALADNTSVSATATASASASSSSSAAKGQEGDCKSEATASAEVTTIVNGKKKTIRQEDTDRGDGCSANARAKAVIGNSQPDEQ